MIELQKQLTSNARVIRGFDSSNEPMSLIISDLILWRKKISFYINLVLPSEIVDISKVICRFVTFNSPQKKKKTKINSDRAVRYLIEYSAPVIRGWINLDGCSGVGNYLCDGFVPHTPHHLSACLPHR